MNACTSPRLMRAGRDAHAAEHGDGDVAEVPEERDDRHDQAGDELRAEAGPEQLRVLVVEDRLDLPTAAEDLRRARGR